MRKIFLWLIDIVSLALLPFRLPLLTTGDGGFGAVHQSGGSWRLQAAGDPGGGAGSAGTVLPPGLCVWEGGEGGRLFRAFLPWMPRKVDGTGTVSAAYCLSPGCAPSSAQANRTSGWRPDPLWLRAAASAALPHLASARPSALAALVHALSHLGAPDDPITSDWFVAFDEAFRRKRGDFSASEVAAVLVSYYILGYEATSSPDYKVEAEAEAIAAVPSRVSYQIVHSAVHVTEQQRQVVAEAPLTARNGGGPVSISHDEDEERKQHGLPPAWACLPVEEVIEKLLVRVLDTAVPAPLQLHHAAEPLMAIDGGVEGDAGLVVIPCEVERQETISAGSAEGPASLFTPEHRDQAADSERGVEGGSSPALASLLCEDDTAATAPLPWSSGDPMALPTEEPPSVGVGPSSHGITTAGAASAVATRIVAGISGVSVVAEMQRHQARVAAALAAAAAPLGLPPPPLIVAGGRSPWPALASPEII